MDKGFKKLRGNRVLLSMPDLPERKIMINSSLTEEIQKETAKKFGKLKVFAVGDLVTGLTEEDEVLVDPVALNKAPIIEIEGKEKLLVSYFDIILDW